MRGRRLVRCWFRWLKKDGSSTRSPKQVARIYLSEAFADGFRDADTLVLGCTHYPLLKPLLHRVAPPQVSIVDSAESTARAVADCTGEASAADPGRA